MTAISRIFLLLLLASQASGQLPQSAYGWLLRSDFTTAIEYPSGLDRSRIAHFSSSEVAGGVYQRGRDEVTVMLVECETREHAFGLFAAAAVNLQRHGIVGDAFAVDRGLEHVNYGPFYLYFRAARGTRQAPDDLRYAILRLLFNRADCYGTDIPLPQSGRVHGSEIWIPPVVQAWSPPPHPALVLVQDLIAGRAAWMAQYTSPVSEEKRFILALPIRHVQGLKLLEAGLIDRYARAGRPLDACKLAAYVYEEHIVFILPLRGQLVIALLSVEDVGGCEWALTLPVLE
jgi:hypothetical protein